MKIFKCPGYEGHICGKTVVWAPNRVRCTSCRRIYTLRAKASYYEKNKVKIRKQHRSYYKRNRKAAIASAYAYKDAHPIRKLISNHLDYILNPKNVSHRSYRNMPFFDAWNPKKSGSYLTGEKWIIKNIGEKPADGRYNLHIIDRRIGFMPENLMWIPIGAHKREELLNKTLIENKQLKDRLKKHEKSS